MLPNHTISASTTASCCGGSEDPSSSVLTLSLDLPISFVSSAPDFASNKETTCGAQGIGDALAQTLNLTNLAVDRALQRT